MCYEADLALESLQCICFSASLGRGKIPDPSTPKALLLEL